MLDRTAATFRSGACHQGAVGGHVDRQALGSGGSMGVGEGQEAVDGGIGAGDGDLARGVDVGRVHGLGGPSGLVGEAGHGTLVEAEHDAHAVAVRVCLGHGVPSGPHRLDRVG